MCKPRAVSGDVPGAQVVLRRQLQRRSLIHDVLTAGAFPQRQLLAGAALQCGPEDVEPARVKRPGPVSLALRHDSGALIEMSAHLTTLTAGFRLFAPSGRVGFAARTNGPGRVGLFRRFTRCGGCRRVGEAET